MVAGVAEVPLGGIVRVTGSGDACPDWPLCYGKLIPPLEYHIVLEYSHRLSATLVGLIVLAVVILAWRHYRTNRPVLFASISGGLLVIAAALLGGLTVLSELTWWIRLIHLSIAELVVASIALAWLGSRGEVAVPKEALAYAPRYGKWVVWLVVVGRWRGGDARTSHGVLLRVQRGWRFSRHPFAGLGGGQRLDIRGRVGAGASERREG